MRQVIFITGTDTGVGKTVLTALLLVHLRKKGVHALAMKPFCSGSHSDVRILQTLQANELSDAEANPYFFQEPLAPLVAAQRMRRKIYLSQVIERILSVKKRCEVLIVEGAGGLFAPLSYGFFWTDIIRILRPHVIVVGPNKLGVLNHIMLTTEALKKTAAPKVSLVLMQASPPNCDISSQSNSSVLRKLLPDNDVVVLPNLGRNPVGKARIDASRKKTKKALAGLRFDH